MEISKIIQIGHWGNNGSLLSNTCSTRFRSE